MVKKPVTDDEKNSVSPDYIASIEDKVKHFVSENKLLEAGDTIVIGVSGGADSLCLLFLLNKIYGNSITIKVVHVHHGLRIEADNEADYVKEICEKLDIEYKIVKADVNDYARLNKMSTEEAGRFIRYQAFYDFLDIEDGDTDNLNKKIAIAHNKNDNAETLLFNLFRGSSLSGLRGIRSHNNRIIRPILCLERDEIEKYLFGLGIHYCLDESNETDEYTRNRIRHSILPVAKENINSGAIENMFALSQSVSLAMDYLDEILEGEYARVSFIDNGKIHLLSSEFNNLHDYMKYRIAYKAIVDISGHMKDIEKKHVNILIDLFDKQVGRSVDLPYEIIALRVYDGIILSKKSESDKQSIDEISEAVVSDGVNNFSGLSIFCEKRTYTNGTDISKEKYTKWFDCDKIRGPLVCRHMKTGDYIEINEEGACQSLRRFCINNKIPSMDREKLVLICDDISVLWIVGWRISSRIKITENTKRIAIIEIKNLDAEGEKCE